MSNTRLILVRHGETDYNAQGRFQGSSDIPLNDRGVEQASTVAPWIARLRPSRIVSSPLGRARRTAEVIDDRLGVGVGTDDRLREIDCGEWEGARLVDVVDAHPWYREYEAAGRDFRRSGSGETSAEVGERVGEALREFAERFAGDNTLVTAHGTAIRTGILNLLGLGLPGGRFLGDLLNCSWSVLEHGAAGWRLLTYNAVVPGSAAGGSRGLEAELAHSAAGTLDA